MSIEELYVKLRALSVGITIVDSDAGLMRKAGVTVNGSLKDGRHIYNDAPPVYPTLEQALRKALKVAETQPVAGDPEWYTEAMSEGRRQPYNEEHERTWAECENGAQAEVSRRMEREGWRYCYMNSLLNGKLRLVFERQK